MSEPSEIDFDQKMIEWAAKGMIAELQEEFPKKNFSLTIRTAAEVLAEAEAEAEAKAKAKNKAKNKSKGVRK